jgi:hypothetical protein
MNFRAAMLSSMNDVAHIPILNQYVATGLKLSSGMKASGREYSELKHVSRSYEMVPEAVTMLCERYMISPLHVTEAVERIRASSKVPCLVDFAWAGEAAKRDEE